MFSAMNAYKTTGLGVGIECQPNSPPYMYGLTCIIEHELIEFGKKKLVF